MPSSAETRYLTNELRLLHDSVIQGKVPIARAVKNVREMQADGDITDDMVARFKVCVIQSMQQILGSLK